MVPESTPMKDDYRYGVYCDREKGSQIKQLQERYRTEIFISSTKLERGTLRSAQIKGNDYLWIRRRKRAGYCGHMQKDI